MYDSDINVFLEGVRTFDTGATRSPVGNKLEYSRFFDSRVMKRFAEYMHRHRKQTNNVLREPDNWKMGIDKASYCESLHRHYHDIWLWSQGYESEMSEELMESLCAIHFNVHGLMYELLKEERK